MKKIKNIDKIIVILLTVLVIFVPFRLIISEYVGEFSKLLSDIIIAILILILIFNRKKKIEFKTPDLLYLLFFLVAFIGTIVVNDNKIINFLAELRSLGNYYLLYFFLRNYKLDKEHYYFLLKTIKIVFFIIFSLAIIEKVFDKSILFPKEWALKYSNLNSGRTYTILNSPNTFGAYVTFIWVMDYVFNNKNKQKQSIIFNVISVCSIFLSASISSTILFFSSFLFFNVFYERKKQKNDFIMLVINFLTILVFSILLFFSILSLNEFYKNSKSEKSDNVIIENTGEIKDDDNNIVDEKEATETTKTTETSESIDNNTVVKRFNNLFTSKYYVDSLRDGRIYRVIKAIEVYKDNTIWGTGFGTFGSSASKVLGGKSPVYEKYDIKDDFYSDNQYICILVETGTIGSIIFISFMFTLLWAYRKNRIKLYVCIIFYGFGMFYNVFEIQVLFLFFGIILSFPTEETSGVKEKIKIQ